MLTGITQPLSWSLFGDSGPRVWLVAWDSREVSWGLKGAGPEECSIHVKAWKNKHKDGFCCPVSKRVCLPHRAVCFLTKACGFVSAFPEDQAWGQSAQGQGRAHGRVFWACVLWWRGCVSVWDSHAEAGGGQSKAGLPLPPPPSCWPSHLLTACLSLFVVLHSLTWQSPWQLQGMVLVISFCFSPQGPGQWAPLPVSLLLAGTELPSDFVGSSTWCVC